MLKQMTVNSIIQYIEENLESKFINIDCLVLYSGFSRRYLQISFKEYVGMPIEHILELEGLVELLHYYGLPG